MGLPSINNMSLTTVTNTSTDFAQKPAIDMLVSKPLSVEKSGQALSLQTMLEPILVSVLDQSIAEEFGRNFSGGTIITEPFEYHPRPKTINQVEKRLIDAVGQQLYYGERGGHDFSAMDDTVRAASQTLQDGYLNASAVLHGLGMLDENISEYLQKSHTRLLSGVNTLKNDYQNGVNRGYESNLSRRDSFSLQVETRDGDVIDINLRYADEREQKTPYSIRILAREISVSYNVDGDLSKAEKTALNDLMEGLGALADRFFSGKGALTEISGLNAFDQGELSSFSLLLKDYKDKAKEGLQSLLVEYDVNQDLQEHTLSALYKDQNEVGEKGTDNYEFNITSSLQAAGFDVSNSQTQGNLNAVSSDKLALLEKQIDFSVDQLNEKDTQADEFYISGLRQMLARSLVETAEQSTVKAILAEPVQVSMQLFKGIVQQHPEYTNLAKPEKQQVDQVLSGLPDFQAEFSAKRAFVDTEIGKREMSLKLGQKTKIEQYQTVNGFVENIEQSDSFKLGITQQELRRLGAQRVVEHIEIDRDAKRAAQYVDGKLIAQHAQTEQFLERKVTNFFENSVGYLTKERMGQDLEVMSEEAEFIRLLRAMDKL